MIGVHLRPAKSTDHDQICRLMIDSGHGVIELLYEGIVHGMPIEDILIDRRLANTLNGYLMYPKVFMDYRARHAAYGPVRTLPTHTFFYGMQPGDQITAEIDSGKRLEALMQTVGGTSDAGQVKVYFELNGQPRDFTVPNRSVKAKVAARAKADTANPSHIAAPMPGLIIGIVSQPGQKLAKGDVILQLDAMKMRTVMTAERSGTLSAIYMKVGDQVEAKDLVAEWENKQ